jgi:NADH-quinone oxidoreductase subunit H
MYHDFNLVFTLVTIIVVIGAVLGLCAYLILIERKVAAYVQDRLGPNRVGPFGLLQPIADGVKFLLKEEIVPDHVDKLFFLLAPAIAVSTALFAIAVVPFGPTAAPPTPPWPQTVSEAEARQQNPEIRTELDNFRSTYQTEIIPEGTWGLPFAIGLQWIIAPHVDVGFLVVFAVGSLAVYGIILGGWSSNSKYSFLGALRSSAQILSYEIPMGLSVLGVVLMSGSLNLERIIGEQVWVNGWNIVYQPLAFILFLTSIFAECNRLPFDLSEAEQELVGGYHTEYSALKFALFFLGEYAHMITTSFLTVALFGGGWYLPWLCGPGAPILLKVVVFFLKMMCIILFSMFIRWTIPRFRFDQLMALAWKVLMPLGLVNLLSVLVIQHLRLHLLWLLPISLALLAGTGLLALYRPRRPVQSLVVYRGHEYVEMTR